MEANNLLLFFDHPNEPLISKKRNGTVAFDVPYEILTDEYKALDTELETRFGEDTEKITLFPTTTPDLSFASKVPIKGPFSLFNKRNQDIAAQLTKIFMDAPDIRTFTTILAYAKDRVNSYLYQYSLSVAMAHRPDTKGMYFIDSPFNSFAK